MEEAQIKAIVKYYEELDQPILSKRDVSLVVKTLPEYRVDDINAYIEDRQANDEEYQFFYVQDNDDLLVKNYIKKTALKKLRRQISDKYNRIRFILAVFVVREEREIEAEKEL